MMQKNPAKQMPFCSKKTFSCVKKNFLLERVKLSSCKNNVKNRYFLKEEMSCHRKRFLAVVRNFLTQEEISCQKKKFLATRRNFLPQIELSQEEISCHRKKFLVTGNLLHSKKILYQKKLNGQKLSFLIENQQNWFIQWEKLFKQKKEAKI